MTFRLLTFGELRLNDAAGKGVAFPEKGLVTICYLLSGTEREQSRNKIARLLWGDVDVAKSLSNLRKMISRIVDRQNELGVSFLEFTPTSVKLNEASLSSDVGDFLIGRSAHAITDLRNVLGIFRDQFLAELDHESTSIQNWIGAQRERHAGRLFEALGAALPAAAKEDIALVKEAALRLFQHNPDDERIGQILKDTYEAEGHVDDARQMFEYRKQTLAGMLETSPDRDALDAVRRIFEKQRRIISATPADGTLSESPPTAPRSPLPRLALLPPADGEDGMPATLARALIEDVTISLCALNTVSIVAPYTAAQLSRDADKAATIERHAIPYILETRLANTSGTLKLFVQLIYFPSDEVIWAERFVLEHHDLIAPRHEIPRQIALAIAGQIERNEMSRQYFERNPIAYRHYLLGQNFLKHLNLPDIRRARKSFRSALNESPHFSPALSGLARTFFVEWLITARGDSERLQIAERHALEAIAADCSLASAYRELGVAKLYLGDFDESVNALSLAEKLSPHYADVIADYADVLVHASRPAEGLKKIERAIALNPLPPDLYLWGAAGASFCIGKYDESLSYIASMKDRTPADRLSAANWAMLDDQKKARSYVRKARETHPDFNVDTWLSIVPFKEQWVKDHYREALLKAGF